MAAHDCITSVSLGKHISLNNRDLKNDECLFHSSDF